MSYTDLMVKWGDLNALYLEANVAVSTTVAEESVKAAWRGGLQQASDLVGKLGPTGQYGRAVMTGEWTEAKWVKLANEVGAQFMYLLHEVETAGYTLTRVWNEIAVPTAVDASATVHQVGAKLAAEGPGLVKWAVVGLVAVAVIYVARVFR